MIHDIHDAYKTRYPQKGEFPRNSINRWNISGGCWYVHSTARTKPLTDPRGYFCCRWPSASKKRCVFMTVSQASIPIGSVDTDVHEGWKSVSQTSLSSRVSSSFPESPAHTYHTVPYDLMKRKCTARICHRCDIRSCAFVWDILQPKREAKILRANAPYDNDHLCGSCQDSQPVQDRGNLFLKRWMKPKKECLWS